MSVHAIDLKKALLDPASVFDSPEALLARADIDRADKIEILRRWEYDASEASVAVEEGMPDGDDDMLHRVSVALGKLGGAVDVGHSPPTKQGGIPTASARSKA